MSMNMSNLNSPEQTISRLLLMVSQPVRIQILLVIGKQKACVCHLEAVLGLRQASISQHLMVLRKAGLVETQREGRNIFYHLTRPEVLPIIQQSAQLAGVSVEWLEQLPKRPVAGCTCPQCNPGMPVELTCKKNQGG